MQLGLGVGQRRRDGVETGDDPLDIAVHRRRLEVEGDRRDRRRGIGADPRQRAQRRLVGRKFAIMLGDDGTGAGMHVARPCVVAEALPGMEHVVEIGRRERGERRPAREKRREIRAPR